MRRLVPAFFAPAIAALGCSTPEEVPLHEVRRGPFVREVQAEGVLRALTSTPVMAPSEAPGMLKVAWLAEDGSHVREGDLLVRFDSSDVERELLEGELAEASSERKIEQREIQKRASLSNAHRDRRLADLELVTARQFGDKDPQIFSRVEIIESRIDEELAREKLSHAEGRMEAETSLAESDVALLAIEKRVAAAKAARARKALGALEVRAPHDGIFVLVRDWRGNTVQPGNTTYRGHPIAELPALDRMEASIYVLEADAGGLVEGGRASVAIEGRPGPSFEANVARVDRMPKPRFRGLPLQYFEATLDLEKTDPEIMKPGQRVRARLVLEQAEGVVAVPRQAVVEEDQGSFVYKRTSDGFEKVPVTLGPASLGSIVIVSGLVEGDVIAARNPERSREELAPQSAEESAPAPGGAP